MKFIAVVLVVCFLSVFASAWEWPWKMWDNSLKKDLPIVDHLELDRFAGPWYEIVRLEYNGEKGCICSQQNVLRLKDSLLFNNTCHQQNENGKLIISPAPLVILDKSNAKFRANDNTEIWVIDVADDYSWNMQARPDRKHLWINSRNPTLDEKVIRKLLEKARELGFPMENLVRDKQVCGSNFRMEILEGNEKIPEL